MTVCEYCHSYFFVLLQFTLCLLITLTTSSDCAGNPQNAAQNWLNHGGNFYNRRHTNRKKKINPKTVSNLHLKWKLYTGDYVSATPAIFNDTIYFPIWNGYIYAVKAVDGSLVWKKNLQKLTGFNNTGFILNVNTTVSRTTAAIAGILGPAVEKDQLIQWILRQEEFFGLYDTRASIYGSESVSNGCIYLGADYKLSVGFGNKSFSSGTTVYAFCVGFNC